MLKRVVSVYKFKCLIRISTVNANFAFYITRTLHSLITRYAWHILAGDGAHVNHVVGKSFKRVCLQRCGQVYWFPRATITNDHKLSGLKQEEFILSVF